MNKYIVLCVLFFIVVLIIIIFFINSGKKFTTNDKLYNGICVFDLDGTLTVDIDNAAIAVSKCREIGYKIAFNTARPTKWYSDLQLDKLGLNETDLESDFYYGEKYQCSFSDRNCIESTIADTKVKHLYTLSNKWNIHPKYIILFDDQYPNIDKAEKSGFSTIFANNTYLGGIPSNVSEKIDSISVK
jgi:hypothetical protein